ncbi:multidrug resistance-associated protein 5-like isoform X6 [Cotesia glomerata]|uniref:multidrug resistance-associated protein 5-like isoform X6 n=1 Tax=Cotesia glomerata TaxID=32391 RepID=UPI001D00EABB|nr:multidrug resistance-associated protein 5-like isoform X6 [Cotesia glomerata]
MIIDEIGVKDNSFTPTNRSTVDIHSFGYKKESEMFRNEYRKSRKLSRYNNALKNLIPFRLGKTSDEEMPIDKAGFFSTISFSWITKYLWVSYRKGITLDDLPKPSPYDTADHNAKRLEALWNDEVMRNGLTGASFSRAAWKFIRTRIFMASLMFGFSAILGFLGPAIVMRKLLEYVGSPDGSIYTGIVWIILLMISDLLRVTFFSWGWSVCYRTGLRMKSAFTSVMYRKLIKTSNLSNQDSGKLINMMSNDSQAVYDLCIYTPMIIAGPIITILIIIYILLVLSPLALSGFLFFFCFYPLQYFISHLNGYFRKRSITISDQRVSAVTEIFNCIKLIKMYAWEDPFSLNLLELRNKEKTWLANMCITRSYGSSLTVTIPMIAAIISFLVHVAGGYSLTAAQSIMCMEENNSFIQKPIVKSQALSIMNGTFVCDVDSCNLKSAQKKKKRKLNKDDLEKNEIESLMPKRIEILSDINFEVAKSKLIGICGHVGSGKSSLLRAALGQIRITNGKISRDGSCAYVSQQAWIQNASLKDNILFGHKFDSHRYYTAIDVCCLQEDIDLLPAADETEIGERGVNLSGGQKQRVALARAYYANQDIYFLDDPLSAVDINVGWYIFENLIQKALKDKSIIFVTHKIPYLSRCDQIYMMSNGRIVEQGDHVSLLQAGKEYASMVKSDKSMMTNSIFNNRDNYDRLSTMYDSSNDLTFKKDRTNDESDEKIKNDEETIDSMIIEPEYMEKGSIKGHTYLLYISAMGGFFVASIVLVNVIINTGCLLFSSWWLATWIKAGSGGRTITVGNETVVSNNIIDNPDIGYYQIVYASCILFILGSSLLRGYVLTRVALIASTTLHNQLFKKIMSTTMQFFESTPKGRLQNLFSRDISELDGQLPVNIENSLNSICHGVLNVLMVCVILPYLTIPFILLSILFYFVARLFRKTLRDLQRHESASKSPIFSFATATLQGLDTIHAFKKETQFIEKFYEYIDLNGTCEFLSSVLLRWAAIRFDFLTIIAYVCTGFTVVLLRGSIPPAMAGLALSFCGQMTGFLQYTIRLLSLTELKFISVERMGFYLKTLKSEDEFTKESTSEKSYDNWPQKGAIEFKNVELRYRKNTPIILNGLSFNVVAGEKLGIVGRTSAGKSSLITALFRLVELSNGSIKIDGRDITTISLNQLRSKLSIIPQDPILFNGSVRYNLDPWKVKTDEEIWSALEITKLKNKVLTMPGQLNAFVDSGGSNMSMGERQLLCLARVLLRKNKIIILDEATASVDPLTESIVQTTIQNQFSDCTIMIIAHRLQNVLSCDRILVLNSGKIVEFDTPGNLLDNPESQFSKMINAADKKNNNY